MSKEEILEEYLDKQDRKFVSEHRLMILEAIENLIKENKELKEKLQEHICIEAHDQVKQLYIARAEIIKLLNNEIINICGIECIAKSDIEKLLKE